MIAALIDAWSLIALLIYSASAAAGIAYSVGNFRTIRRATRSLHLLKQNGAAQAAATGFLKLHLALLGAQGLEGALVAISLLIAGPTTVRGQTALGIVSSTILICINLLLSYASVASTNGYRRARAYVRAEEMAEGKGWDGAERRAGEVPQGGARRPDRRQDE